MPLTTVGAGAFAITTGAGHQFGSAGHVGGVDQLASARHVASMPDFVYPVEHVYAAVAPTEVVEPPAAPPLTVVDDVFATVGWVGQYAAIASHVGASPLHVLSA